MLIILIAIAFLLIFKNDYQFHGINKTYLSIDNTSALKGFFIILVFLSHIRTYTDFTLFHDDIVIHLLDLCGQLMVTLFLFFSGYGVFLSVTKKGFAYIQHFPKNRLLKTFIDFAFAIALFYVVSLIIGKHYSFSDVLISLSGWRGIGNSNWYMFVIFALYLISYVGLRLFPRKHFLSLTTITILSLGFVYLMTLTRPDRFANTALCYTAGMWYAYFKPQIDKVLFQHASFYYPMTIVVFALFFLSYPLRQQRILMYNLVSILFCLCFVFITMKVNFKSKSLIWFGKHLFWIYILQRIPMILFSHFGFSTAHPYIFLYASFFITLCMAKYAQIFMTKVKSHLFGN